MRGGGESDVCNLSFYADYILRQNFRLCTPPFQYHARQRMWARNQEMSSLLYRRICSFAGESMPKLVFCVNSNSYTAWLGTVDSQCPAYLLDLRTPPPWHPPAPSISRVWEVGMVIRSADRIACLPMAEWVKDGQAVSRRSNVSFGIFK